MKKIFSSIGLMSGTSGDGIDGSIIQSDGEKKLIIKKNTFIEYKANMREEIRNLKEKINILKDVTSYKKDIETLEKKITYLNSDLIQKIIKESKINLNSIDVIGFHGQTIFHDPKNYYSKQLGDGFLLSNIIKKKVVYDFRKNDLKNGGQGAPLTPIYHDLIRTNFDLKVPVAFVNIGGISNITYIDKNNKIFSFDTGPGNFLIDRVLQKHSNNKIQYDKDGEIAFKGKVNEIILETFLNDPYYNLSPPKSLDVNDFNLSGIRGLSLPDSIATLSELTTRTIFDSIKLYNNSSVKIILCGGGRKNKYIFQRLNKLSNGNTINIDSLNIDGDFIESQAFAYLAIRSLLNLPISFPSTTGVKNKCTGGTLVNFK